MNTSGLKIAFARKRLMNLFAKQKVDNSCAVGIILGSGEIKFVDLFENFLQDQGLEPEEFKILACGKKIQRNTLFDYPVFNLKDIGLTGTLKNTEVSEFLGNKFDILISFTEYNNKLAGLLMSVAQARLKVGRLENGNEAGAYDFLISSEESEAGIFIQELKKYLKIITKQ